MYSALSMAKYIIDKCTKDKYPISNLQLQKILYYIQRELMYSCTIRTPYSYNIIVKYLIAF